MAARNCSAARRAAAAWAAWRCASRRSAMASMSLANRASSVIRASSGSPPTDGAVDSSRAMRRRLFPGWAARYQAVAGRRGRRCPAAWRSTRLPSAAAAACSVSAAAQATSRQAGSVLGLYLAFAGIGLAGAAVLYEPAFATVNAYFGVLGTARPDLLARYAPRHLYDAQRRPGPARNRQARQRADRRRGLAHDHRQLHAGVSAVAGCSLSAALLLLAADRAHRQADGKLAACWQG